MADRVSILVAEDQELTRLGLKLALGKIDGVDVIGEAADGQAVIDLAGELKPHIILMDIGLPIHDGIYATQKIKSTLPETRIIMFTSDETDDTIFAALNAGADGYCLKKISTDQLSIAINSVMMGAAWLDPGVANRVLRAQRSGGAKAPEKQVPTSTAATSSLSGRHIEVLQMIEKGHGKDLIAVKLKISVAEVDTCLKEILSGVLTGGSQDSQTTPSVFADGATVMSGKDDLRPGARFAEKYVIKSVIGEGGMSIVYDAQHEYMDRRVAIKMLHEKLANDKEIVNRFRHEARASSAVQHQNLVAVYDSGVTANGQPYIVMDYLDGMNLQEYIEKGQPDTGELIAIFCQVCDALEAAHKTGLIHRDLKPSNIMLIPDDKGNAFVKLVDFGIAKFVHEQQDIRLTQTGQVFGTPAFMSPEQCRSEDLDVRTDMYSLGCVMYEAFTNERAFVGKSVFEVLSMHVSEYPSRVPFLVPGTVIMSELERIVFRCINKDKEQRPASAQQLKHMLVSAYKTAGA
ncbi:MAG: protein kinase [Candidatus Obscuribacterales bacterium]|nr:protein kinase [Candidatus Obscuribacterales bacterium]